MKIADLRAFVAVVENGLHVPRAAEAVGIPLASLHSSIDRLEREVGHPLFTRGTAGWTLTSAGSLLLAEAERRIAEADAAYNAATMDTPERRDAAMAKLLAMRAMLASAEAA